MMSMVLLIALLLCVSAFFSASETALFSLSRTELHAMGESDRRTAHMIVESLRNPRSILITILLGNELTNVSISIIGAALIARTFSVGAVAETLVAVAFITPAVLIIGEIIPKNLALRFATHYALFAIMPLKFFSAVTRPVRTVLTAMADAFIRLLGGRVTDRPMIMEHEYRQLVDLGRREGAIIETERELIHNIFEFTDKTVASIMTPADRLFSLPIDMDYEEMLKKLDENRYSRVPLYAGNPNNIVGILHLRDIFAFDHQRRAGGEQDIRSVLIDPIFVGPAERLEDLLHRFQKQRVHMAIVVHPDDTVAGVVTMDDVLEDLFGEIEQT